jgi:D-psicose/D-tagatose/L-ribulose 3-epimerase
VRFGICVYVEDIPAAERAGYEYVELTVTNIVPEVGKAEFETLKKRLRGFSIRPEGWRRFIPTELPVVGQDVNFAKITDFVRTTLGRIGELGGKVVVFGSPGARNIPESFLRYKAHQQLIRFLQMTADVAAKNDIIVVIEPVPGRHCNVLNSVPEAVALAQELGRPEIKVLADLFHMTVEGEPVGAITEAGERLYHVHMPVPDIPGLSEPRNITTRLPTFPNRELLEELWGMNYKHRVSVEDLDRRFMNLEREAPFVLSHLKATWESFSM